MVISRTTLVLPLSRNIFKNVIFRGVNKNPLLYQHVRWSGEEKLKYRGYPEPHKSEVKMSFYVGAALWWWVLWHVITDYHELYDPVGLPNPTDFTDEELGIPPI